jgi:hypothetical protein
VACRTTVDDFGPGQDIPVHGHSDGPVGEMMADDTELDALVEQLSGLYPRAKVWRNANQVALHFEPGVVAYIWSRALLGEWRVHVPSLTGDLAVPMTFREQDDVAAFLRKHVVVND